jgi:hypothetical protein
MCLNADVTGRGSLVTVEQGGAILRRMPDATPPSIKGLTAEEIAKIRTWIETRWVHKNCPFCGHIDWHPAAYLVATLTISNGAAQMTGRGGMYGYAPIFCGFCGFSVFVNAGTLGLLPHAIKTSDQ